MTTMIKEVYDAFREANVSEETASKAAQAMASHEDRFNRVDLHLSRHDGEFKLLKWMGGIIIIAVVVPIVKGMI